MKNTISTGVNLLLVAVLFVFLVILNNEMFGSQRLDLTEDQVYSLSDGSKQVIQGIDEPINLYFFFSDKAAKDLTSLRNYASRVESLLREYATEAKGKINLQIIDPEPFSEAEDRAAQFGLTAATIGAAGDVIYMGLAATNSLDGQAVIGFFDPQQERFLEYEISKLIYQLSQEKQSKVTVMTDLNLQGGQNPMTGQYDPAWTFYTQLQQLYEVEKISLNATEIPVDTQVLMLLHPVNLSEAAQYALDQYLMDGGNVMVFVDPHFESDPMNMMAAGPNASVADGLLSAWGLKVDTAQVVLDALSGLDIRTQTGGVARHMGYLGLGAEQLDDKDIATAGLDILNMASAGAITVDKPATLSVQTLIRSSAEAGLLDAPVYAQTRDPLALAREFDNKHQVYTLAVRLSGVFDSAFAEAPESAVQAEAHKAKSQPANVIVVADVDLLADRFWVQQSNFFGQTIYTPFANNGDFVINAVENLSGNNALISIRSRGTFARPFTEVEKLTLEAEKRFRQQEELLQRQLEETEAQLSELQAQQGDNNALVLGEEQQAALDAFLQKKIQIRKALREVRHQLEKDIEELGDVLKLINIAVAPLVLVVLLFLLARMMRSRGKTGAQQ